VLLPVVLFQALDTVSQFQFWVELSFDVIWLNLTALFNLRKKCCCISKWTSFNADTIYANDKMYLKIAKQDFGVCSATGRSIPQQGCIPFYYFHTLIVYVFLFFLSHCDIECCNSSIAQFHHCPITEQECKRVRTCEGHFDVTVPEGPSAPSCLWRHLVWLPGAI